MNKQTEKIVLSGLFIAIRLSWLQSFIPPVSANQSHRFISGFNRRYHCRLKYGLAIGDYATAFKSHALRYAAISCCDNNGG